MERQSKEINGRSSTKISDHELKAGESSSTVAPPPIESQPSPPDPADVGNEIPSNIENVQEDSTSSASDSSTSSCSPPSSSSSSITSDGSDSHSKSLNLEPLPMVLGGCQRCHMYVMLQKQNPRCPRCKSSVLVNFFRE